MSVDVNESISSLFDDELDAVERNKLIDKLKHDSNHQEVWHRYGIISQAMKRDLPSNPSQDLFFRIQSAIASEPSLLSPSPSTLSDEINNADVVELPAKPKTVGTEKSNPVFGLAVAASFALMTVVGFQFLSTNNEADPGFAVASSQTTAPVQDLQIVSRSNEGVTVIPTAIEEPLYAEQSVINDGQWTRITHIGNLSLNGHLIDRSSEAHANVLIQRGDQPFTRPVNMENAANQ